MTTQDLQKKVGARIAAARSGRDLSQRRLAALIGADPSTVNMIEKGRRLPSIGMLYKLAAELGGEARDFLPDVAQRKDGGR